MIYERMNVLLLARSHTHTKVVVLWIDTAIHTYTMCCSPLWIECRNGIFQRIFFSAGRILKSGWASIWPGRERERHRFFWKKIYPFIFNSFVEKFNEFRFGIWSHSHNVVLGATVWGVYGEINKAAAIFTLNDPIFVCFFKYFVDVTTWNYTHTHTHLPTWNWYSSFDSVIFGKKNNRNHIAMFFDEPHHSN